MCGAPGAAADVPIAGGGVEPVAAAETAAGAAAAAAAEEVANAGAAGVTLGAPVASRKARSSCAKRA